MSLLTLSNPTVSNVWNVVLDEHSEVENDLPLTFFNIKNGSSLTLIVHLNGSRAGIVEAYSMDTYLGKQFETFTVSTKDGDNLAIDDIFVQVGNNIQMTTSPYNPSWEMLEENINQYASGCDGRLSYSSAGTPIDVIKYWINTQNAQIVQRRLSIQGSASLGTYEITFDPDTIITGGTPINGEVLDTKQYKKTIQNGEFDYSITNCSIKGWMIDYLKRGGDLSSLYTVITGGVDAVKAYDDDLTTYASYSQGGTAWTEEWKVDMGVQQPVSAINIYITHKSGYSGGDYRQQIRFEISVDNSTWETLFTDESTSTSYIPRYHNITTHTLKTFRYIRMTQRNVHSSGNGICRIYDVSLFE